MSSDFAKAAVVALANLSAALTPDRDSAPQSTGAS